jgi:transposase
MPSHPSPPAETRRRAANMFQAGLTQAEAARALGVSRQTASRWHAKWSAGGVEALEADTVGGRRPRLSDEDFARVERALAKALERTGSRTTGGRAGRSLS